MEDEDAVTNIANIAALGQLARFAPDAFEQKSDVIMTYIVNHILMVPTPVVSIKSFCRRVNKLMVG